MPVYNRIAEFHDDMTAWRREIHAHPELCFEEVRTSALVAEKLQEWGIKVHTGIAKTGVVGVLKGQGSSNKTTHPMHLPAKAKCMPVGMTGIPLCYWGLHVIWLKPETLMEPSTLSSNLPKKAEVVPKS